MEIPHPISMCWSLSVLVTGCYNKPPETRWFKTTVIMIATILWVKWMILLLSAELAGVLRGIRASQWPCMAGNWCWPPTGISRADGWGTCYSSAYSLPHGCGASSRMGPVFHRKEVGAASSLRWRFGSPRCSTASYWPKQSQGQPRGNRFYFLIRKYDRFSRWPNSTQAVSLVSS